jgi:hypothetical protein
MMTMTRRPNPITKYDYFGGHFFRLMTYSNSDGFHQFLFSELLLKELGVGWVTNTNKYE